jgi:hypothetical protein
MEEPIRPKIATYHRNLSQKYLERTWKKINLSGAGRTKAKKSPESSSPLEFISIRHDKQKDASWTFYCGRGVPQRSPSGPILFRFVSGPLPLTVVRVSGDELGGADPLPRLPRPQRSDNDNPGPAVHAEQPSLPRRLHESEVHSVGVAGAVAHRQGERRPESADQGHARGSPTR